MDCDTFGSAALGASVAGTMAKAIHSATAENRIMFSPPPPRPSKVNPPGRWSAMFADPRRIAVAFCAIGAFLHLYAPQAVLPMMAREYGVGAADASLIITAGTLAVAATAPFAGALSDVIGRKRLIVVAMALLLIPAT